MTGDERQLCSAGRVENGINSGPRDTIECPSKTYGDKMRRIAQVESGKKSIINQSLKSLFQI